MKASAKNFYAWLGILLSAFALPVVAQAVTTASAEKESEVVLSISDVYVPSGFDAASDAFVVVNGLFPNTCYKWKEATIMNIGLMEHEIRSIATVNPGMCLMMLVPFQREVHLGHLAVGRHTLKFVAGDGTFVQKQMTVE